ncbi:MAG: hypothetical protein IJ747_09435 [Lachnospiraceae bacterium]|nr:hypothetical protein [Lachnospiraceae bacterium]
MGFFDAFKKKDGVAAAQTRAVPNAAVSQGNTTQRSGAQGGGAQAGRAQVGGAQAGSTAVDPAKQLRVKFGTKEPVPFVDSETGAKVELRAFGIVTFAVQDVAAYQTEEQAQAAAQKLCVEELENQINRFSGSIRVTEYGRIREEFMMAARARLQQCGLLGVADLSGINLTDESKAKLAEAQEQLRMEQDPTYAEAKRVMEQAEAARQNREAGGNAPGAAAIPAGEAAAVNVSRPKFCPNCGTPTGTDKFCRNCGHPFGG